MIAYAEVVGPVLAAYLALVTTAFVALRVVRSVREWRMERRVVEAFAADGGLRRRFGESNRSLRARARMAVNVRRIEIAPYAVRGYTDEEILLACPNGMSEAMFLADVRIRQVRAEEKFLEDVRTRCARDVMRGGERTR